MREIRTLRATWRGLETWCESGLPGRTGAPALDPTCERPVVKSRRPTHPQDEDSGRQFYVRTLKNRRLGGVSEITEGAAFSDYARLCGRTLARAHARSGDPAAITGYSGKSEVLDDAIASFAMAYAKQTILDHAALVRAKNPAKSAKAAKAA